MTAYVRNVQQHSAEYSDEFSARKCQSVRQVLNDETLRYNWKPIHCVRSTKYALVLVLVAQSLHTAFHWILNFNKLFIMCAAIDTAADDVMIRDTSRTLLN